MGQLHKNSDRIRNILEGNYTSKTKVQSGYKKEKILHTEGDVWDENGKTWTIKNGIKQTISKLDYIRKYMMMPLLCPQCGCRMKKRLDKKFWSLKRKCFDCTIEEDTQRMIDGTFNQYEKEYISKNIKSWLHDIEAAIGDYVNLKPTNYVTEDGQIEDWVGGHDKEELSNILNKQIEDFKEKAKDFINSETEAK